MLIDFRHWFFSGRGHPRPCFLRHAQGGAGIREEPKVIRFTRLVSIGTPNVPVASKSICRSTLGKRLPG